MFFASSYHRQYLAIVKRFNLPAVSFDWLDFCFLLFIGQLDLFASISAVIPHSLLYSVLLYELT